VFVKLRKAAIGFVTSVRIEQVGSHCTYFHYFDSGGFFEILSRKFKLN